jgi:hypothetical protein
VDTNWEWKRSEDPAEVCDPKDPNQTNWWNGWCSDTCEPIVSKWELVIKKELVWPKEVKSTWDIVKWNIRVTASWWDVTDFTITDKMPEILEYYRDSVTHNPWVTVGKATINGNNVVWKVTWTLKKWEYVEIQLETKVKWMPTEDIENVACVKSDTQPEKCANDDVPVKWELDVVKTLVSENKYVTHTWQKLEWSITVTAKNWDVKMESIRDVLPEELAYSGYKKEYIPSWITIEEPKLSNNDKEVTWKTTWTLKEWEYIELRVITTVIKMPQKTIKNVACAKPEDWKEECNPWYTHDLQIRKYVWNNQKNQWDKSMTWEVWGKITYKITFGNNGDESVFVVLKDYLPKWVRFLSGTLVVWSQSSAWDISDWNLNMVYKWDTINIDGIKINTYTGVLLKPNQSWVLTIEWEILKPNSENESRTNFACIFDDKWNKIDCDDAKHNIEEKEIKCEKLEIPAWELDNSWWTKEVKCTASDKADLITIDCWEWAIWDRYITKANTDVVSGKCSYPSWAKTYSVRCEVKNGGNPSNSCNWSVTVKWWPSCFPAWTQVAMADGLTKNIEDIEVGDEVLSYNTDTNTNETNVVVKKFIHENNVHEMYELTINWEVLKVTNVHPFYVRKSASSKAYSWVEAQDLKVWDILLMVDGSLVTIEKINHYSNQETVYNLEVEGNHDYFVDRWYLVHNKWWCVTNCDPTPYCNHHPEDAVCQFANPQCFNVNNWNVSVELWEYLPIYINLYKDDGESPDYNYMVYKPDDYPLWEDNISGMIGKECKDGDVALNSIMCKYIIKNEKTIPVYSDVHPCLDGGSSVDANPLIIAWAAWQGNNYRRHMQTYLEDGTPYTYSPQVYMINTNTIREIVGDRLWEYQYQVEIVDFAQCMDGKRVSKKEVSGPAGPVCQNNFVLTEPYTVQKTPAWNLTASIDTLFKFKDVNGNNPFSKHLDAIATSNYEPNNKVDDAMEAFIKKYEKLAVSIDNTTALKKVPGKNIYFVKWDIHPSKITTLNKPVTFIQTEWNTIIDWDVDYNVMVLTKWDIIFQADCTKNLNVKWIFYAAWNLKREGDKKKNNSTNNNRWCDKWWLHVKWVLIWNNFKSLMENSRSHLENWFHANNDKRKEIMDWASVLIEYSPSIFTKSTMPPGAEDFTTALSIYKQ